MTEASLAIWCGSMSLESFVEKHKGVRRTVLAICIVWVSVTIGCGLYVMLTRSLNQVEVTFMLAIVALMQTPIGFYFYNRGKQ